MNNVIAINDNNVDVILNTPVRKPTNSVQYLKICKRFLTEDDYASVCIAILDQDEFEVAETQIKNIVETYFSFLN